LPIPFSQRLLRTLALAAAVASSFAAKAADPYTASPARDEIFYHFMPIAWRDSNNDTNRYGDFGGMTASLDYLKSLGVTSVWMTPIFPSAAYHGYQHGPADQINSWFGDETGFRNFLAAAKAKDIKVFIDFVVYGISHNSVYYANPNGAYNRPSSIYDTWLAFTNTANTQYQGYTFNTWTGTGIGFIHWDLRNSNPANLVTQWARKWLDPDGNGVADDGVAGYRFDHCWVTYPNGPGGWGYNLDTFWTPFFASLRALKPDVFLFGEQADWGTPGGEFLSQFDAMFTIPFQFAARSAISAGNASGLYSSMDSALTSARAAGRGTMLGIIGNHDNDRIASVIGADTAGSINKARAAAAVLMLQPFPPCLYFGDELAMTGRKGSYGSDADDIPFREPFKWNAVAGAPMTNYFIQNTQAYNNRYSRNNDGRSVQEQSGVSGSVLETYRTLGALRSANVALRRGQYAAVPAASSAVWSFLRRHDDPAGPDQSLVVAINLSGSSVTTNLNFSGLELPPGGTTVSDLVSGAVLTPITAANRAAYSVTIPAFGYRIVNADLAVPPPPVSLVDGSNIPADLAPAPLAELQNTPTNLGDNVGELNQLLLTTDENGVRIGITGNLPTDFTLLAVFLETSADGVSTLFTADQPTPPNGLPQMSGIRFDDGFAPDTMLLINGGASAFYVDQLQLVPGASIKTYRGTGAVNSGSGLLTGGDGSDGVQVAINNTNSTGVTGASAANAALASRGIDMVIPYAALGLPGDTCATIRVAAMLVRGSGAVTNQTLPGLNGRATDLGIAPNLNLVAGSQFLTLVRPASCPPGCGTDYNGDRTVNLDDLSDFITDFYTDAAIPGGRQAAAPTFSENAVGHGPCPSAPNAPLPYAAEAYRNFGYRVGFSSEAGSECPLSPEQNFPNLDNLSEFISRFYVANPC
jgi:alpha-amylase